MTKAAGLSAPATIVVGEVARLGRHLDWVGAYEEEEDTGERRESARSKSNVVA